MASRAFLLIVFSCAAFAAITSKRGYYCRDPESDKWYPVNSTWRSTTFCGNYTCKSLRQVRSENGIKTTKFNESIKTHGMIEQANAEAKALKEKIDIAQSNDSSDVYLTSKLLDIIKNKLNAHDEDRFLTDSEIAALTVLLQKAHRNDINGIIEIYNLAQEIYKEINNDITAEEIEKAFKILQKNHKIDSYRHKVYWYEPEKHKYQEDHTNEFHANTSDKSNYYSLNKFKQSHRKKFNAVKYFPNIFINNPRRNVRIDKRDKHSCPFNLNSKLQNQQIPQTYLMPSGKTANMVSALSFPLFPYNVMRYNKFGNSLDFLTNRLIDANRKYFIDQELWHHQIEPTNTKTQENLIPTYLIAPKKYIDLDFDAINSVQKEITINKNVIKEYLPTTPKTADNQNVQTALKIKTAEVKKKQTNTTDKNNFSKDKIVREIPNIFTQNLKVKNQTKNFIYHENLNATSTNTNLLRQKLKNNSDITFLPENMKNKPKNRPIWQTDPLNIEVLNDIRANIEKSKFLRYPFRKMIKLENVTDMNLNSSVLRSKRNLIETDLLKQIKESNKTSIIKSKEGDDKKKNFQEMHKNDASHKNIESQPIQVKLVNKTTELLNGNQTKTNTTEAISNTTESNTLKVSIATELKENIQSIGIKNENSLIDEITSKTTKFVSSQGKQATTDNIGDSGLLTYLDMVKCPTETKSGYFSVGDLSLPFPACCPQLLQDPVVTSKNFKP